MVGISLATYMRLEGGLRSTGVNLLVYRRNWKHVKGTTQLDDTSFVQIHYLLGYGPKMDSFY